MKWIALLLVMLGVTLAAATGARNTSNFLDRQEIDITAGHHSGKRDGAHKSYCEARAKAKQAENSDCHFEGSKDNTHWKTFVLKDKETAKRVDAAKAALVSLKSSTETLDAELSKKRKAWVDAFEASIPAETAAWAPWEPPKPLSRLTAWLKANGIVFVLGLILIIGGGLLARKVQREEATATPQQDDDSTAVPVVDFEELLKTLNEATLSLHAALSENTDPDEAAFNDAQSRIETIQQDQVNRLIDARISVQVRYGVAGFAQIFGPMSAGERNLNRAWSAIVDCHWPEAVSSVEYAAGQFEDACKQMESLRQTLS